MAKGEKKIPEWILSDKEEKQLSPEDKMMYYKSLREYCRKRKLVNTTFGAMVIGPKLKNVTGKICAKVCKMLSGGTVEVVTDGFENIPEGPVIFASSHQSVLDGFVWITDCPKHALIVHGAETD